MRSSGGALSRLVRAVSVPLLFAEVSEIVVHVTDTVFLARVGTVEVGAIALADSLLEVAVVLTVGLIEGIQILFATILGSGGFVPTGRRETCSTSVSCCSPWSRSRSPPCSWSRPGRSQHCS